MQNSPFGRARPTPGRRLPPRRRALRCASLLLGTSLLHAAPAWAANECGPPPPGGGTVTCPAGNYPNGITYFPPNDLEVLLQPGVVSNRGAVVESANDIRFLGPVDTKLNSDILGYGLRLRAETGTIFADVDDVVGNDSSRPAVAILGRGSVTLFADTVVGLRGGVEVQEGNFGGTAGSPGTHVRINSVTTTGDGFVAAVYTNSTFGDVRTEVGSISTSGHGAFGIESVGGLFSRTVFIDAGTITTTGAAATGIRAFGLDLDVRSGSISTSGPEALGILTSTYGGDTIIVSGSIVTRGRLAPGISAGSGLGDIDITSGSIVTTVAPGLDLSPGIAATTIEGDVVVRSGSVSTAGYQSEGIRANSTNGDVFVDSGTVATSGPISYGIYADSVTKQVTVIADGTSTTGEFAIAILALSDSGSVSVRSGSASTAGRNAGAILASANGGGTGSSIVVADRTSTLGSNSTAISAVSFGHTSVTSNLVTTAGSDSYGIAGSAFRGDLVIRSGAVFTTGPGSNGIRASGQDSGIQIFSDTVATTGAGSTGISVDADRSGDISVVSREVRTASANAVGIFASATEGAVAVTNSGTVTTGGATSSGIAVSGTSIVIDSAGIGTAGDTSRGITASSTANMNIASKTIATLGADSAGILARTPGGEIRVVSGAITTQGAGSAGIDAASNTGAVIVTATDVGVAGAQSDAIVVTSGTGSQVTVLGLVRSQQGLAVQADGGAAVLGIAAGGTVRGRIDLTGAGDRVNNAGLFDALGTSQFGAGADLFANQAGGTFRSVNGASVMAGLESFANQGRIEMRDGATGDSVTLTGAYSGLAGGRLGLDVDFATSTADRLITGAATGSTLIDLMTSGVASGLGSILLVDAGAGTSPTAFSLGTGAVETPYLVTRIRFDAANNDFLLDYGPGAATFETARFAAMATRLWYESADAVAAQLDTARDGRGGRGIGLWLQAWSGDDEARGRQSFGGETFDVSFEQDFQGLQGGVDIQTGAVAVGITGGAGRSDATFLATGNPVDMEVRNIGAYLQGRSGPLFFNALAKYDWAELEIAPGAGLGASFDADSFGVQANAGVRLGFGSVFAEPSVGLSWVQSEVDAFASGPATIGPGEGESLRARAGLRVGAKVPLGGGALLPFAAVNAYEELSGENSSDFTLGDTLRLLDEPPGTRGQAAAGVSFVAGSFEAFVRGDMDFSGESDARSVRAGARLRF